MKKTLALSLIAGSLGLMAGPFVQNVTLSQDPNTCRVTIKYTVTGEPAIATVDIRTNDVSIGAANYRSISGSMNRLVQPNVEQTAYWAADKDWPDHVFNDACVTAVVTVWATNAPPDYFVQNLVDWSDKAWYTCADALPGGVTNDTYKTQKLVLRRIPAAEVVWTMGSPLGEQGRAVTKEVARQVVLSKDYYMSVFETTERQWCLIMGKPFGNSAFLNEDYRATRPVSRMMYSDLRGDGSISPASSEVGAGTLIATLREKSGLQGFDLPTEAQWEFACRAGTDTMLNTGYDFEQRNVAPQMTGVGRDRYHGGYLNDGATKPNGDIPAAEGGTARVGSLKPNAWGLYDMHGNVYEWCRDWYTQDLSVLSYVEPSGPRQPSTDAYRAVRGGSYNQVATNCRSAKRKKGNDIGNEVGFRLCWLPTP